MKGGNGMPYEALRGGGDLGKLRNINGKFENLYLKKKR